MRLRRFYHSSVLEVVDMLLPKAKFGIVAQCDNPKCQKFIKGSKPSKLLIVNTDTFCSIKCYNRVVDDIYKEERRNANPT